MKHRCNINLAFGAGIIAGVLLFALLGQFYTPYLPARQVIASRLLPPTLSHPLGTDHLGRDTLSRLMEGAGYSLFVGILAVGLGAAGGTALGMIAGTFGRWVDEFVMRVIDFVMGFPIILLAILVASVFGPGMRNSMTAIAVANIPIFARLVRGNLLSLKEEEFVMAARASGANTGWILLVHLLPHLLTPLIIQGTVSLGTAILADAGLSYLGLGVQPPHASWGRMIYEARSFLSLDPWLAVFPGTTIAFTILGFNLLGDGLRDRFDPRGFQSFRKVKRRLKRRPDRDETTRILASG
ncbi:MAG TPA: ABC transporter permease [Candidatus Heimdallarchaeota archaeon]|nr:ABC transporter permease [Candidatus Heimdallarchaeota archaeon]